MAYEEARVCGAKDLPLILRKAAAASTPSVCLGLPCAGFDPQMCKSRKGTLSHRQRKMCAEKISAECDALKIEASFLAHYSDHQRLLELRRSATEIHKILVELDPVTKRVHNQRYLEYWQFITEGQVSLLKEQFGPAKDWFNKALETGRSLDEKRCFPNYFSGIKEIAAHEFYIDALDKFRQKDFKGARAFFRKWLDLNPELATKNNLRFDNIKIFEMICDILERLPGKGVAKVDWDSLEKVLEEAYVARTTWVLWSRLLWLRELSFKLQREADLAEFNLTEQVNKLSQEWRLLTPDVELLGEDRSAGLRRRVNLPAFIDIFDHLDRSTDDWPKLLHQNLKHLFLLMGDYERRRYLNPPPEEAHLNPMSSAPVASEKMTILQLAELISLYLNHRSMSLRGHFDRAISQLERFTRAIESKHFTEAVASQKDMLEIIRSWPHVIVIREQAEIPKSIMLDEDNPRFVAWKSTAVRLWNREPKEIIFEGPQKLTEGYYYLRPKWNVRSSDCYRVRHEQFYQSNVPRWMNVFFQSTFIGRTADPKRFDDWILQFGDTERLLACRLSTAWVTMTRRK